AAAQRAVSPSSAGGHLNRRRAVGHVHRVGHRDEHFARSLEALPAVRGADVVHKHQVTSLPWLACGVCLVDLVDQLHDVRVDRGAVAEAGIGGPSPLLADKRLWNSIPTARPPKNTVGCASLARTTATR